MSHTVPLGCGILAALVSAGDKIFVVFTRKGDPAKAEGTWQSVDDHEWGTYTLK